MRSRKALLAACAFVATIGMVGTASAWPQRKDYFLDAPIPGTWVHLDVVTAGVQTSLEHRRALEDENLGMLHLRASTLASIGYAEAGGHLDLRVLGLITFGASAGYRYVWNNLGASNEPNRDVTRAARRAKETLDGDRKEGWPYYEGRARLVIPLERLWFVSNAAIRWEDSPTNTFDWFHTNIHDGGTLYRFDATLFFRDEKFGGIGPTIRYLNMPYRGDRKNEIAYGITFGTRIGIKARNDVLLVQTLFRFGDDQFGWHQLGPSIPAYVMVIYRASFKLF